MMRRWLHWEMEATSWRRASRRSPQGFTLLEVTLASSLFAVIVLYAVSMQISSFQMQKKTQETTEASQLLSGITKIIEVDAVKWTTALREMNYLSGIVTKPLSTTDANQNWISFQGTPFNFQYVSGQVDSIYCAMYNYRWVGQDHVNHAGGTNLLFEGDLLEVVVLLVWPRNLQTMSTGMRAFYSGCGNSSQIAARDAIIKGNAFQIAFKQLRETFYVRRKAF